MFSITLARKIVGIALVLIVLMTTTATVSVVLVIQAGDRIGNIVHSYIPAYAALARANIRSLERSLALRRMVIEKMRSQTPTDAFASAQTRYDTAGKQVEAEAETARTLIDGLIETHSAGGDMAGLARLSSRIENGIADARVRLSEENERLLVALGSGDARIVDDALARSNKLRDDLNQQLDSVRSGMLDQVNASGLSIERDQREVIVVSIFLTLLAAALGIVFSILIGQRMTRPLRRLVDGARAVAAGRLDEQLSVQSTDEIGRLTDAFNNMVGQLREKERLRETFGKYVDPRVVEGLMTRPDLAQEGQRRVMTVMFCDIKGFTEASERMTPQGLVKIMNRYFSVMSAAIGHHGGVIDKYIGDAIMAYWGAPFVEEAEQASLASRAALEMRNRLPELRAEFPELIGLRELPMTFDIRIGIATGEALVGSIGSEIMMNYTVMGDTVNLASRMEGINKFYGTHVLITEPTRKGARDAIEAREIDRVVVLGQTKTQTISEIMAPVGQLAATQFELRARFSEGLEAYRAMRWDDACLSFDAALEVEPDDGPSKTFLSRIEKLRASPPDADWDGAWHLDQK